MSGNTKKMIAFNYFGGKFNAVEKLYAFFPEHHHFVDLFCGSLVVTLNKIPSKIDTANDINGQVVNFFKVLREQPEELISLLYLTPVSREEYNNAWDTDGCNDLERARRFYTRLRQSFFGLGSQRKNKGWHMVAKNSRCNVAETVSKWNNGIEKLLPVIDRLKAIQIENKDFREFIPGVDDKNTFFYCDPPYPKESRSGVAKDYMYEFTEQDHIDLADMLNGIKGKAMVSGYRCDTMDRLYKGWHMIFLGEFRNITGKKGHEYIWMNYEKSKNNQINFLKQLGI